MAVGVKPILPIKQNHRLFWKIAQLLVSMSRAVQALAEVATEVIYSERRWTLHPSLSHKSMGFCGSRLCHIKEAKDHPLNCGGDQERNAPWSTENVVNRSNSKKPYV